VQIEANYSREQVQRCDQFLRKWSKTFDTGFGAVKASKTAKAKISFTAINKAFTSGVETVQAIASLPSIVTLIDANKFKDWTEASKPNSLKLIKTRLQEGCGHNKVKNNKGKITRVKYLDKQNNLREEVELQCSSDPKILEVFAMVDRTMEHNAKDIQTAEQRRARNPKAFAGVPEDYLQRAVIATQALLSATTINDAIAKRYPNMDIAILTGEEGPVRIAAIMQGF
jgi:hypothetical protein